MTRQPPVLTLFVLATTLGGIPAAQADLSKEADTIFNWAERNYPQFFPSHDTTKNLGPWLYRYYSQTNTYVGVNSDGGVYLLGGAFGDSPYYVGTSDDLFKAAAPAASCGVSNPTSGFNYSQTGNVINITTNGCIALSSTPACDPSGVTGGGGIPPQATGISVLVSQQSLGFSMGGYKILMPNYPDPLQSFGSTAANAKYCMRNAPYGFDALTVNMDVCYDMTATVSSYIHSIPGVIEVTPPITMATKSQTVSQPVNDCFATDATTVYDVFTGESWMKQNGGFVKIK